MKTQDPLNDNLLNSIQLKPQFSMGGPLFHLFPEFFPPQSYSVQNDEFWMLEALKESLQGVGITNPNPAIGCVIVDRNNQEITRGSTQAYRSFHAERVAFQKIPPSEVHRLEGGTAYVTLEPCSHQGYQPPCVELILQSPLRKIVIARGDPNPVVNGRAIELLRAAGKEVVIGPLAHEVTAWNFPFFSTFQLKRPLVALKWAQTLDGQLADDSGHSKWITGPVARAYTHWLRQKYDIILVGAQTVLSDFPRLDVRDCPLLRQTQPLPVILDPKGICFKASPAIQERLMETTFRKDRPVVIATSDRSRKTSVIKSQENIHIIPLRTSDIIPELITALSKPDIQELLGHPLQSIFVEGGAKTLTSFLNAGYADVIHAFTAPLLTGGLKNRISTHRPLQKALQFQPVAHLRLGSDFLTEMISTQLNFF